MIVMAGNVTSYEALRHLEKSSGKVCAAARKADTMRYNGYSTSGRRSNKRHPEIPQEAFLAVLRVDK